MKTGGGEFLQLARGVCNIQLGEHVIHHYQIGLQPPCQIDRVVGVEGHTNSLKATVVFQVI
jgi:hypothetical protein